MSEGFRNGLKNNSDLVEPCGLEDINKNIQTLISILTKITHERKPDDYKEVVFDNIQHNIELARQFTIKGKEKKRTLEESTSHTLCTMSDTPEIPTPFRKIMRISPVNFNNPRNIFQTYQIAVRISDPTIQENTVNQIYRTFHVDAGLSVSKINKTIIISDIEHIDYLPNNQVGTSDTLWLDRSIIDHCQEDPTKIPTTLSDIPAEYLLGQDGTYSSILRIKFDKYPLEECRFYLIAEDSARQYRASARRYLKHIGITKCKAEGKIAATYPNVVLVTDKYIRDGITQGSDDLKKRLTDKKYIKKYVSYKIVDYLCTLYLNHESFPTFGNIPAEYIVDDFQVKF